LTKRGRRRALPREAKQSDIWQHWPLIVVILIVFPLAVYYARQIYAPCDDSYIFFVYARNFVEGNGLTYNGTAVEGFSSVIWVGLLSLLALTRQSSPAIAELLSTLSGLGALIATYFLARGLDLEPHWALLPVVLLAATGDFAFYMSVGLEQVLFTALLVLCVGLVYRVEAAELLGSYGYSLLLALLVLTRWEGALVAGLLLAMLALSAKSIRLAFRCGLIMVATLAPVMLARYAYFGYWLPNTYHVKGGAGLSNLRWGLEYLDNAAQRYLSVLAAAALLGVVSLFAWAVARSRNQPRRRSRKGQRASFVVSRHLRLMDAKPVWPLLLITGVWLLYVVIQGGDNMVGGRLLVPVLPLIYVSIVRIARIRTSRFVVVALASAAVCALVVVGYVRDPLLTDHRASWEDSAARRHRVGVYLRDNYPPDTLIALNPAGIIPYRSGLRTIDMLGLNDVHIAHEGKRDRSLRIGHQAGDGVYVLSQEPDLILFSGGQSPRPGPYISDREIWASPEFRAHYELVQWPGVGVAYSRRN